MFMMLGLLGHKASTEAADARDAEPVRAQRPEWNQLMLMMLGQFVEKA